MSAKHFDRCKYEIQFYHHLPVRYRNCPEIKEFIDQLSTFYGQSTTNGIHSQLTRCNDKTISLEKLPKAFPLPSGIQPVIMLQVSELITPSLEIP